MMSPSADGAVLVLVCHRRQERSCELCKEEAPGRYIWTVVPQSHVFQYNESDFKVSAHLQLCKPVRRVV